jgi:polyisoprenyl-teichoic acid--peptidoglycan teichoic acid transferase
VKSPNKRPVSSNKAPSKPRKSAKPGSVKLLWLLLCLTGVAMLSATAGALLAVSLASTPLMQRQLSPTEASIFGKGDRFSSRSSLKLPELTRPVNILILGAKVLTTDVNNPPADAQKLPYQALVNSFDGLTDVMLLLRFSPETKKFVVLSIPRDTRTYIPDRGVHKINEANADGGPALAARSVSELMGGVGIDRYVTINVQGVQALIDALGGVTVYVPKDMKYKDDSQHLYVNLKAGRQHLNGDQTLQLLRFRYDENGDIGRIQRQQMVMRALMEQALNPTTVARVPKLLSVIQTHIDTNLTVEELVALSGFAAQVNRSNTKMLMVPGEFSAPGEYDASYWLPHPAKIQSLVSQHFDFGAPSLTEDTPALLRVAIQDSTKQEKGIQKIQTALRADGFNNVYVGNPWTEPLSVTRIVAQQGDVIGAEAVRRSLGFGEVRIENTGDIESDVTIQLGKDALQPVKKVPAKETKGRSNPTPSAF